MNARVINYGTLLRDVQPQVIRDSQAHGRYLAQVDRLMAENAKAPNPAYAELIDLLATLIAKYEDEALPMPASTPVEVLRHLMEARNLPKQRLAKEVGISPSHLSNILSGERQITVEHARNFARIFAVSPLLFIDIDRGLKPPAERRAGIGRGQRRRR
jgi:HTH-type transcriptional regulator/antitoxin HigA